MSEKYRIRHFQYPDPDADERKVEREQHGITYVHAHAKPPKHIRMISQQEWSGLNAVNQSPPKGSP
jgi:hypothetical protein